jgi:hypothetical protein
MLKFFLLLTLISCTNIKPLKPATIEINVDYVTAFKNVIRNLSLCYGLPYGDKGFAENLSYELRTFVQSYFAQKHISIEELDIPYLHANDNIKLHEAEILLHEHDGDTIHVKLQKLTDKSTSLRIKGNVPQIASRITSADIHQMALKKYCPKDK